MPRSGVSLFCGIEFFEGFPLVLAQRWENDIGIRT